MNKKATSMSFYVVIFGILIFLMLLFPTGRIVGNAWSAITGSSSPDSTKAFEEFTEALFEVAEMEGEVAGDSYFLSLPQETAIIAMNPGSDFSFVYPDPSRVERARYFPMISIRGSVFNRSSYCSGENTCVCLCEGLGFESEATEQSSEKISCGRVSCRGTDSFYVREKTLLDNVFDFDYDSFETEARLEKEILSRKDEVYWDNSLILVRHPDIGNTAGSRMDWTTHRDNVAGYGYFVLPQRFDVFIYKSGVRDGKPVIGICFKEDPVNTCLRDDRFTRQGTI